MRRWIWVLAILTALLALVRNFPLSWAAASLPEAVGVPSGTIWKGQFDRVPLLGSVSVTGGLGAVTLATPPGDVSLSGEVSPSGVKELRLSMPVAQLPTSDTRLSGLLGRISLRIDTAEIEEGACVSATGTAATDVLAVNRAQFEWAGPELSGPVDCVDGRLRVRLSGQSGNDTVNAEIQTGLDGVYQSEITVATPDVMAGNALTLFGFNAQTPGQYRLFEQGRWR